MNRADARAVAHVVKAEELWERLDRLALDLHAQGRAATARRSHTEGSTLRIAANRIRRAIGLPPLDYDGEEFLR